MKCMINIFVCNKIPHSNTDGTILISLEIKNI